MSLEFESPKDGKITRSPEQFLAKKEEFLRDFRKYIHDYIEEFPEQKIMPSMPNYQLYKCRTNFFNSIYVRILLLQQLGLINSTETQKECGEFLKFCETLRGRTEFYKQEDIDKANRVLDVLIRELSP